MDAVNKVVKEYDIRFNVTEQVVGNKGFLEFEAFKNLYKDEIGIILSEPKRGLHVVKLKDNSLYMFNHYGMVKDNHGWFAADVKVKPDKWVVEKDENHPMWERFKKYRLRKAKFSEGFTFGFYSEFERADYLDCFKDHQYLTLNQWYELFCKKGIDFSIIDDNPDEWFYIRMKKSNYGVLIKKCPIAVLMFIQE